MKVLVTGHRGFIGRYVFADWRKELGYQVHGIDHPDDVGDFNISGNMKKVDYELVVHLAAWADIRESMEKPAEYYENNVVKAKRLFDWCGETGTRLLYASSSAVDGNYWENPYAMSKWINEQMAPANSARSKIPNSTTDLLNMNPISLMVSYIWCSSILKHTIHHIVPTFWTIYCCKSHSY